MRAASEELELPRCLLATAAGPTVGAAPPVGVRQRDDDHFELYTVDVDRGAADPTGVTGVIPAEAGGTFASPPLRPRGHGS
jgi:hypothetical protein